MTATSEHTETAELFPVSPELAPASACLRIFDSHAHETRVACLHGFPQEGVEPGWGEGRKASVLLAVTPDGAVLLESGSVEWWDALITRAQAEREKLVYPLHLSDLGAELAAVRAGGGR